MDKGGVNWIGLGTLAAREIRRFLVVWVQTLLGPVIAALLFVAIFAVVLGRTPASGGSTYLAFIAPGLIMMAMMQNAFANASSSILIAKLNGTIADVLVVPLWPCELTIGFTIGAVTRGLLVGMAVALLLMPLGAIDLARPGLLVLHGLGGTLAFALLGIITGVHAERMEHIAFMSNVVVAPLTILSGTFYAIELVPEPLRILSLGNPVFHLIDGFRAGMLGRAEGSIPLGIALVVLANVALMTWCVHLFATARRLKP